MNNAVKLAYLKQNDIVSVFTDASNRLGPGVITSSKEQKSGKNTAEQEQKATGIKRTFFSDARDMDKYEKEPFAILKLFNKVYYIL